MKAQRAANAAMRAVRGGASRDRVSRQRQVDPLEPQVQRAVQRFVRLLAWSGCSPQAIEREVAAACRNIPRSWTFAPDARHRGNAEHVLTLWFADPAYLSPCGQPRPLPLRGSRLSLEALTRRVDPKLDVQYVLRYLEDGAAVKRVRERYLPQDRVVIFRDRAHTTVSLAGLFGLLRTLEHNQWAGKRSPRRLQRFARNPSFPAGALGPFERRLRQFANRFLVRVDADMHRREKARRRGERTVRMGVGVYQFEEDPSPNHAAGRGRTQRRKKI